MIKAVKKGIVLPFLLILTSVALILGAFFLLGNKPKTANQIRLQTVSPSPTDETVYTEASRSVNTDAETTNWKTYSLGNVLTFKVPKNYYLKFGGTTGKDVVVIADKESSINAKGNFLTIDANGLSGYHPYSNYESIVNTITSQVNESGKIQKLNDRITLVSTYNEEGKPVYGLTEYIKYKEAGIYISFQSEDITNPHMFDKIISTFKFLDQSEEGTFCGGIAGIICPTGYECLYDGNYPDAGGKCVEK